jgi:hypothetical protein
MRDEVFRCASVIVARVAFQSGRIPVRVGLSSGPTDEETCRIADGWLHAHGARLSLRNANWVSQGLSVSRDRIVFNQGEITGNIWMTEIRDPD